MKKIVSIVLTVMMALLSVVSVAAATGGMTGENNGISVKLDTGKDKYKSGESIIATITLENTGKETKRNVAYEIKVPNGFWVENGAKGTILTFEPGATEEKDVVIKYEGVKEEQGISINVSGGILTAILIGIIVILIVVIIVVLVIVLLRKPKNKKGGNTDAMLMIVVGAGLALALILSSGAVTFAAKGSVEVKKTVEVDGKKCEITLSVEEKGIAAKNIGIHDPSVFQDPVSGNYYSYGSHIVAGGSEDLVSWDYIAVSSSAYAKSNKLFEHHYLEEFSEVYKWLGADVVEGIWALDVTYSEEAAKAGNDPYLMYVTVVNGSFKSAICLATSDKPEGPFSYKGMIVCSDFRKAEVEKGYTNLLEALGVKSVDEMTSAQKAYYFTADSAAYKAKLPDAIDAAPFYDADGNLYLTYGSFTCKGGLRVLKLDAKTGLRSSDVYEYKSDGSQDPYYGIKIANANGEGPYILRVESDMSSTGSYYFLFWSQGNLRATGGYNMRMFRSEYPDHGFVDYAGQSALADIGGTNLGVRIMDGFKFYTMAYPSTANGGNSAIVTDEGKIFVHYHSKSSDTSAYGENGFIIKSNQMFLNEDGWLVTAPFKYSGETLEFIDKNDVAGDYEFIYHRLAYYKDPAKESDNYVTSDIITLKPDGSISGVKDGKWSLATGGNEITISIDGKTYKGVVLKQCDESVQRNETIVFTASGTDNRTVWGSKIYYSDEQRAKKDGSLISVEKTAVADFELPSKGTFGSEIKWTSDNGAIVIEEGMAKVVPQGEDSEVTLSYTITYGDAVVNGEVKVKVPAEEFDIPSIISSSQIELPKETAAGQKINWTSSDNGTIDVTTGKVNVPSNGSKKVTLTGKVEGGDRVISVEVTVMPMPSTVVYEENFDDMASISAGSEGGLWYSKNAADSVTLQNLNGGKYVQFAPGRANSRGAISTFDKAGRVSGLYVVEFDLALTAGDNQTTEFALATNELTYSNNVINDGIGGGYIFKLSATNSETWAVNDGDTFEIKKGQWIHVETLVNSDAKTATITISSDGVILYTGTVDTNSSATLQGFYVRGGRYDSITAVDNIVVKQN